MSLFLAALLLFLLYTNRHLCIQNLYLHAQLVFYRIPSRSQQSPSTHPEWFRRLSVWICRITERWKEVCLLVQPATVLDWHRRRYRDFSTLKVRTGIRRSGRPPITEATIEVIRRMNRENPLWTPRRIQGALYRCCGIRLHHDTIRKYMVRQTPDPIKALSWQKFLALHMPQIAAMDFFIIPRVGKNPLIGFFVLATDRRRLLHINVTSSPTADWLQDQLMLALGTSDAIKYLLSDNDQLYRPFRRFIRQALAMKSVTTQIASPWQNGISEGFIRTLREELLNCIIPISETTVHTKLLEYQDYYNPDRTHSSIELDSPDGRDPPTADKLRRVRSESRVSGLHRRYYMEVAASTDEFFDPTVPEESKVLRERMPHD